MQKMRIVYVAVKPLGNALFFVSFNEMNIHIDPLFLYTLTICYCYYSAV